MELVEGGPMVAAVQRPDRARAARSAPTGAAAEADKGPARTGKARRSASRTAAPRCPEQGRSDHYGRSPRRDGSTGRPGAGQPSLNSAAFYSEVTARVIMEGSGDTRAGITFGEVNLALQRLSR